MKYVTNAILAFLIFLSSYAQEDLSLHYANTISTEDLEEHLAILASDALEGRETGERGQKMAAAYLEHYFKKNDLESIVMTPSGNSFVQSFNLVRVQPGASWIKIGDNIYENLKDIYYTGKANFTNPERSKLVFVGNGVEKDYQAIQVNGKNVLIYSDGNRISRSNKSQLALSMGAKNVFFMQRGAEEDFKKTITMYKRYSSSGKLSFIPEKGDAKMGYFLISISMGAEILNVSEKQIINAVEKSKEGKYAALLKFKSEEITFYASQHIEKVSTENVLGFIEGTTRKDEYVILSAHYDHIGVDVDEINNGADDDGSGTVAIMEIAQAFSIAKKEGHGPKRSILFLATTGEEKGLLGSEYYVNHPAVPLEKTIANLNIDMIGRVDSKHIENPNYVYLIGSDKLSKELHEVSEQANATYTHLELDYRFNAHNDPNRYYYRSDHYNFAKNNIPVIFYFNGTHEDYHRPTDTVDKIEFDILESRTKLIFHTAWEIANRKDRIVVDVMPEELNVQDSN